MSQNIYGDRIARLVRMQGSDPGFLALALHSFVEAYAAENWDDPPGIDSYGNKLGALRRAVARSRRDDNELYDFFGDLIRAHEVTNEVRHQFAAVTEEELRAQIHLFQDFVRRLSIPVEGQMVHLEKALEIWDRRESHYEALAELRRLERELNAAKRSTAEFEAQLARLNDIAAAKSVLEEQVTKMSAKAERLDSKNDELRQQRHALNEKIRALEAEANELGEAKTFVRSVMRMTTLSRSRRDYERSITRLTPEQEDAVSRIGPDANFLVRGAPGTGKTVVLIEGLRRLMRKESEELGLQQSDRRFALVTFTNALVRYDRFLASLMIDSDDSVDNRISTIDAFFREILAEIEPGAKVVYGDSRAINVLQEIGVPQFVKAKELLIELNDNLFANDLNRDQYIEGRGSSRGKSLDLQRGQRAVIWRIRGEFTKRMIAEKWYTARFARHRLFQLLSTSSEERERVAFDYLFVDEIQDLTTVDFKVLALLSRRSIIMAGDSDQSIYNTALRFSKLGIDIRGRAKILKSNFRNTEQIVHFANAFRAAGGEESEQVRGNSAFRTGPTPEVLHAGSTDKIRETVLSRVLLLTNQLGYALENISVLTTSGNTQEKLAELFRSRGINVSDLKNPEFSFAESTGVRLSTIHSSKGLDLPAVIVVLDNLYSDQAFLSDEENLATKRNLVYVAMTRAMDYLAVIYDPSRIGVIRSELESAWQTYQQDWLDADADSADY